MKLEQEIIINELLDPQLTDWNKISSTRNLSKNFINKYKDKLNWEKLFIYDNISEEEFEQHISNKVSYEYLIVNNILPEEFLIKYKQKIDLHFLFKYGEINHLTDKFLFHSDININWKLISKNLNISEEFMDKYRDKLNMEEISL